MQYAGHSGAAITGAGLLPIRPKSEAQGKRVALGPSFRLWSVLAITVSPFGPVARQRRMTRLMANVTAMRPFTTFPRERAVGRMWRWSLARQFLVIHFGVALIGVLLTGIWIGNQIESTVLSRTAGVTALYVDSLITPRLQNLATSAQLSPDQVAEFDSLVTGTALGQGVVVFKIWSPDGRVLYSPDRSLIGQQFPTTDEFQTAVRGQVAADMSDLSEPENLHERALWSRLIEVYAPVRRDLDGRIIAVNEFYLAPDQLDAEISAARLRAWVIISALGISLYAVTAGIVKRGSDTIEQQRARLQEQVSELASLHERVLQAANRTTTLNEQALRRISADLHDGPGQVLALASLRMDALGRVCGDDPDYLIVNDALRDALKDVRSISNGLRLPELEAVAVQDILDRAINDHERRTGTWIERTYERLPARVPLAVKIAVVRTLQEALSNATRHARGADVVVRAWGQGGHLYVEIADSGPGFDLTDAPSADSGHLGLAGMRERAELLGGSFTVRTAPRAGTTVRACWPVVDHVAA
jgi:signal transduction histidine kinase